MHRNTLNVMEIIIRFDEREREREIIIRQNITLLNVDSTVGKSQGGENQWNKIDDFYLDGEVKRTNFFYGAIDSGCQTPNKKLKTMTYSMGGILVKSCSTWQSLKRWELMLTAEWNHT